MPGPELAYQKIAGKEDPVFFVQILDSADSFRIVFYKIRVEPAESDFYFPTVGFRRLKTNFQESHLDSANAGSIRFVFHKTRTRRNPTCFFPQSVSASSIPIS